MIPNLLAIGRLAHAHAHALSAKERVELLGRCSGPWDNVINGTFWPGGVKDTRNGEPFYEPLDTFADFLIEYSNNVVQKGAGVWFAPADSKNGRCRDQDIERINFLGLDADNVGDWDAAIGTFELANLAFVAQRSSSHRPECPKFHVYLPTLQWWAGEKPEWREIYRHCVAWFSVAAELAFDLDVPRYGFDLATDRLGQPWFLSARRSAEQPRPELIYRHGNALDLEAFLQATDFKSQAHVPVQKARAQRKRKSVVLTEGGPRSVLELAFLQTGWLGPGTSSSARLALCPWRGQHSTGYDYDGSTVLFPPSRRTPQGWFHCSHSHCRDRTQRDVMRMLPPHALAFALTQQHRF